MENNSKFSEFIAKLTDSMREQEWYQQIKRKWDELDPQSRSYLQIVLTALFSLSFIFMIFSLFWGLHSQRKEIADKQEVLRFVQDSNEKIRKLGESGMGAASSDAKTEQTWSAYIEATAGTAGIDKPSLNISAEKPGAPPNKDLQAAGKDTAKESLVQIDVKHVSIKQIIRFAYSLESGTRPIKLRNLTIDTKNDPTGYMDASLSVSGFTIASAKDGK